MIYWLQDHLTGGHFRVTKILSKIQKEYYWPQIFTDVDQWINNYVDVSQKEDPKCHCKAPLQSVPAVEPWNQVTCYVVGLFPATNAGNE